MKIAVIGNGAIGLAIAREFALTSRNIQVTVIGPSNLEGSGTAAAAAMLTCFGELEKEALMVQEELDKFNLSRMALELWPSYLENLDEDLGVSDKLSYGLGTFIINTSTTDQLDDSNFDCIVENLIRFNEPYSQCEISAIPNYKPKSFARARRAIYLEKEGWLNPRVFLRKLEEYCKAKGHAFIDSKVSKIISTKSGWRLDLENQESLDFDNIILANGANVQKLLENSKLEINMQRIFYGAGASVELEMEESGHEKCIRTPNRGMACGIYSTPFKSAGSMPAVLVGATNFISKDPVNAPRLTSLKTLLDNAENEINEDFYKAEVRRINLGWRPTSQDTFPLVGKTSLDGLFIATGTKRDGVHLSPIVAKYIVQSVMGESSIVEFSKFAPERDLIWTMNREQGIKKAVEHKYNGYLQHGMKLSNSSQTAKYLKDIEREICSIYELLDLGDKGIPVELLDMYKYGHAKL